MRQRVNTQQPLYYNYDKCHGQITAKWRKIEKLKELKIMEIGQDLP